MMRPAIACLILVGLLSANSIANSRQSEDPVQ